VNKMSISGKDASSLLEMVTNGEFNDIDTVGASEEDGVVYNEEISTDESTNLEDTDNEDKSEDGSDTDGTDNESDQEDTDESEDEAGDGDTQDVEESGSDADEAESTDEDTDTTEVVDESTDTEDDTADDGVDEDTEEDNIDPVEEKVDNKGIDVEEYKRLKDFHDELTTTKFKVNGREKTGLTEVKDLIIAQQRAGGIEKKFKAVKDIQPFMESMKDNGFLADPAKYELMVRAGNGDIEAIKQILINNKIDPLLQLDIEDGSQYTANNEVLTPQVKLDYAEVKDVADQMGVSSKFDDVVFNQFDDASRAVIFKDSETTRGIGIALAEQIENGLYDQVMSKVDTMELRDPKFASMSMLDRYNTASQVVNQENADAHKAKQDVEDNDVKVKAETAKTNKDKSTKVKAEKAKIEKARKEKAYKAKAKEQEKKTDANRSKATNSSKPKLGVTSNKKSLTPLASLNGEEFTNGWGALKEELGM